MLSLILASAAPRSPRCTSGCRPGPTGSAGTPPLAAPSSRWLWQRRRTSPHEDRRLQQPSGRWRSKPYGDRRLLHRGARPGILVEPGPQRSDRSLRYSTGKAPLLVVASLAAAAADGVLPRSPSSQSKRWKTGGRRRRGRRIRSGRKRRGWWFMVVIALIVLVLVLVVQRFSTDTHLEPNVCWCHQYSLCCNCITRARHAENRCALQTCQSNCRRQSERRSRNTVTKKSLVSVTSPVTFLSISVSAFTSPQRMQQLSSVLSSKAFV